MEVFSILPCPKVDKEELLGSILLPAAVSRQSNTSIAIQKSVHDCMPDIIMRGAIVVALFALVAFVGFNLLTPGAAGAQTTDDCALTPTIDSFGDLRRECRKPGNHYELGSSPQPARQTRCGSSSTPSRSNWRSD
jgi:hypothetical protein